MDWSKQIGKEIESHKMTAEEKKADELAWRTYRKWGLQGTKKRAADEFQKMIRYEAADDEGMVQCVTCGFENHWKNSDNTMHAGHYLGGRTHALLFVEATKEVAGNCHPQCARCNDTNKLSGNMKAYQPWMIETYGAKRVEALEKLKYKNVSYSAFELNQMRLEFKRRSNEAKKRLEGLGL